MPVDMNPPRCRCLRLMEPQGHHKDQSRRLYRCPRYPDDQSRHDSLILEAVGTVTRRRRHNFRVDIGPRPPCPGCGEPMAVRQVKTTLEGEGRYFVCGDLRCEYWGIHLWHQQRGGGWVRIELLRGPRRKSTGADKCPHCEQQNTLFRAGYWDPKKRVTRVMCRACQKRFRFDGTLQPARPAGFQRKYSYPICPIHGEEMPPTSSHPRTGVWIKLHTCLRKGCGQRKRLGPDGREVTEPIRKPATVAGLKCHIPGCGRLREDQADGRKRFCVDHAKLTYMQRSRLKQRKNQRQRADLRQRLRSMVIIGDSAPRETLHEFSLWFRDQLDLADLTLDEAARRSGEPKTTLWNWIHGISAPRTAQDFDRVGRTLGRDLIDFEVYRRSKYEPHRMAR